MGVHPKPPVNGQSRSHKRLPRNKRWSRAGAVMKAKTTTKEQEAKGITRRGTISWDAHYDKLVQFMKENYPDAGFVTPPTADTKFYNWVCTQRSQYRRKAAYLTDDQVEKLDPLGFLWEEEQPEESEEEESQEGSDSEEEEDEAPTSMIIEDSSSSKEDGDSEPEDSDASASSDDENGPGEGRVLARRRLVTANGESRVDATPNPTAYASLGKRELLQLFMNQMDHVELLRKENAELQSKKQRL
mmetsp:Transcript_20663/g.50753  ORF Transcript_20663/g.50753 Transcript_20663/m.50753 type:complete len:244 (-) Transcript_20663:250-981(-)